MHAESGLGGEPGTAQWRLTSTPPPTGWIEVAQFGPVRIQHVGRLPGNPATDPLKRGLAGNIRLSLAPSAALALDRGDVDERLALVLAHLASVHSVEIAAFPVVPGEYPGLLPLRRVLISSVDDRPAVTAELVRYWLEHQLDPYRPAAVDVTADGVLVRYRIAKMEEP
jgi:hypothetical protein